VIAVSDAYATFKTIIITMPVAVHAPTTPGGIKSYYQAKIEAAELTINQKTQNLRRLEAQRNALNARGKRLACYPVGIRINTRWFPSALAQGRASAIA